MRVSPEDFVRAWQASSRVAEVARKLGLSLGAVRNRANYYRKKGVRLKHFPNRVPFDIAALNALIDAGEQPPTTPRKKKGDSK